MKKREIRAIVRKENFSQGYLRGLFRIVFSPSTNAVYLVRKYQYYSQSESLIWKIRKVLYYNKLVKRYGLFIGKNVDIGLGLRLPHPNGIIIGNKVKIGENTTIFQQVTIGSARSGDYLLGAQPCIGSGTVLFAGSKVLGEIVVGDNTIVGANSTLLQDTIDGGTWVGCPARLVKKNIVSDGETDCE